MDFSTPVDQPETADFDESNARTEDEYTSFVPGHEGKRQLDALLPKGFKDDAVLNVTHFVVKPDGDFFNKQFPRIGQSSQKGDVEARRSCLLRYLLKLLPRAQIIDSGGTDASFHVVVAVDESVSNLLSEDRLRFQRLLNNLRVMAFCDKIGDGILSALTARAVGSINTKTGREVTQVHPGSTAYGLDELERLVNDWFSNPTVSVFRAWFGVETEPRTRCPFHDSDDTDLLVANADENRGLACCGQNHCARDGQPAVISMVPTKTGQPALSVLLLTDPYCTRWKKKFKEAASSFKKEAAKSKHAAAATSAGKVSLVISNDTTDDEIASVVAAALKNAPNIYCKPDETIVSIDKDVAEDAIVEHRHDDVNKLIALVNHVCVVSIEKVKSTYICPLPFTRANVLFHHPELRKGLKLLRRVSKNPVLDTNTNRVLPPGYDSTTGIYYDGPVIQPRLDGTTPMIDKLFSGYTGFCDSAYSSCRDERAIAHLYAALFTEVLADNSSLFTIHRHPLFRGNQKGVGKDKLAEILGTIRDGETPADLQHEDDSRINQAFGNGVLLGRRIFQITNIETSHPYANPLVTRWATSEALTCAKHGGGDWKINPNTATFVFTLNQGTIGHDLLDRLLPIDLEVTGDAKAREFDFNPVNFVREHRLDIIAEVLGLAVLCRTEKLSWEIPVGVDRRFEKWMHVIGTMLMRRGLPGFMSNMREIEVELDENEGAFEELANRVWAKQKDAWLPAKDILAACRSGAEILFARQTASKKPERDLSRNVLKPHVGKKASVSNTTGPAIEVVLECRENKKAKSSEFRFAPVVQNAGNGGDGEKGGDGGDAESDPRPSSPPLNSNSNQQVVSPGGDSGDKAIRATIVEEKENNNSSLIVATPESIPSNPAIPAEAFATAAESDPWGGTAL